MCLEHVSQIKEALGIAGVHAKVNAWQCEADKKKGLHGSQIDLLIVRDDQITNVCETKYSGELQSIITEATNSHILILEMLTLLDRQFG